MRTQMEYKYYLTVDNSIEQSFGNNVSEDVLKEAILKAIEEKDELSDVRLYRVPFDLFVRDFQTLIDYAEDITIYYLPEDSDFPIL